MTPSAAPNSPFLLPTAPAPAPTGPQVSALQQLADQKEKAVQDMRTLFASREAQLEAAQTELRAAKESVAKVSFAVGLDGGDEQDGMVGWGQRGGGVCREGHETET